MTSPFETLIIRSPFIDEYDRFEDLARRSKRAGVTHLTFTEIPRSYWEIDDPDDPYLQWSIVHTSIFKICPPDILKDWVPADYCRQARETIAERARILKRTGMRGAAFLYDPMYWPEQVFARHPELRGPRVDHPNRSRHTRFAPCTDQPAVQEMYRDAFRRLGELSEGVLDVIVMRTNDSGTGFCWSALYDQPNGPAFCQGIGAAERGLRFMQNSLEGLRASSGPARFYIQAAKLAGEDEDRIRSFLAAAPEACGCYIHGRRDLGGPRILKGNPALFPLYPIKGIPCHVEILDRLAHACRHAQPNLIFFTRPTMYGADWYGERIVTDTIAAFNQRPGCGPVHQIGILRELAAACGGEETADDLVRVWRTIFEAAEILQKNETGMNMIFLGCLAERWLTRPLVVFPEELTDEERAHYRPYLFQPNARHENFDLLDCQTIRQFDGRRHLSFFMQHFHAALSRYKEARQDLRRLADAAGPSHPELNDQAEAMDLLLCFMQNIHNVVNFQIILEEVRQAVTGNSGPAAFAALGSQRAALSRICRSEIDNTLTLAGLVEGPAGRHIELAPRREDATPFLLGPDLAEELRKKARIMLGRVRDIDRLVAPPNF